MFRCIKEGHRLRLVCNQSQKYICLFVYTFLRAFFNMSFCKQGNLMLILSICRNGFVDKDVRFSIGVPYQCFCNNSQGLCLYTVYTLHSRGRN